MLAERQFSYVENPFGIVFDPLSMARQFSVLMSDRVFVKGDLFQHNLLWHSWLHHGRFSGENLTATLENMNQSLVEGRHFLEKSKRWLVTFGTAHVFVLKKTGSIVANCHKAPPQYFDRRRLSVEEIVEAWTPIFQKIETDNSLQLIDCQIILTVSPIRHARDGFIENNRSKATLLLAADKLARRFAHVTYFPAYELLMDDLRDYRFYAADMLHPNAQAVEYIWQFFSETFFSDRTKEVVGEVEKIRAMQAHRPLHGLDTEGSRQFREQLAEQISEVERRFPFLKF